MERKEIKRSLSVIILLVLVGAIGIGYAIMSSNLKITGSTTVTPENWNVHFENIANAVANNSDVTVSTAAHILELTTTPADETDDLNVGFAVSFKKPGDSYTFNVDVVNDGSLYAKCTNITTTVPNSISNYVEITYTGLAENQVIAPNGSITMTVVAKFKESVQTLPAATLGPANLEIGIEFEQTTPTV